MKSNLGSPLILRERKKKLFLYNLCLQKLSISNVVRTTLTDPNGQSLNFLASVSPVSDQQLQLQTQSSFGIKGSGVPDLEELWSSSRFANTNHERRVAVQNRQADQGSKSSSRCRFISICSASKSIEPMCWRKSDLSLEYEQEHGIKLNNL